MRTWFKELKDGIDQFTGDLVMAESFISEAEKVWLIGNGGSAAIASHIATDFTKNAGIPAQAFNDVSLLTCYANDFGWENVFARAIDYKCSDGDVLIAISSSGKSKNILNGVLAAADRGMHIITLSGFDPHNPLRTMGDINFYVPSDSYGVVEICHLAILHSMVSE